MVPGQLRPWQGCGLLLEGAAWFRVPDLLGGKTWAQVALSGLALPLLATIREPQWLCFLLYQPKGPLYTHISLHLT